MSDVVNTNRKPLVRIQDIWKARGPNMVLKGVSLNVYPGEVVCLLGPSGAGKSTLLRCINAIELGDRGMIYVNDRSIGCHERDGQFIRMKERELSRQRAEIGMVFQNFNLFPHMSVLGNIIDAPMRVRGMSKKDATEQAQRLLERVGLPDKISSYPRHLSGGQQQRVAIARALAMSPKVMLFDEPTSALDPHLTDEVLNVIRDLAKSGMTMVIVTHEIQFAKDVADKTAIMADGVIAEFGDTKTVLSNPSDPRARAFLARHLEKQADAA
jgi:polar amino acid transport system ATP-binding protein